MKNFNIQIDSGMVVSDTKTVICANANDAEAIARRVFGFSGPRRFIIIKEA